MNEDMMKAWVEISSGLAEPSEKDLDAFLRTWQRAMEAERGRLARECERLPFGQTAASFAVWIRNGGRA